MGEHLSIAAISEATGRKVRKNLAIHNFEDGMEYYAAIEIKCECIITEDIKDFYFSDIEVIITEDFFEKYLTRKVQNY